MSSKEKMKPTVEDRLGTLLHRVEDRWGESHEDSDYGTLAIVGDLIVLLIEKEQSNG